MKSRKNGMKLFPSLLTVMITSFLILVCEENPLFPDPEYPNVTREEKIPDDAVKMTPDTDVSVVEGENQLVVMPSGTSIGAVVNALNALGVSPRDLIAIFQAIKAAGALQAELEVI